MKVSARRFDAIMKKIKSKIASLLDWIKWFFTGKYYVSSGILVIITFLYAIRIIPYGHEVASTVFSIGGLLIILFLQLDDARKYANYRPFTPEEWIRSRPNKNPVIVGVGAATFSATTAIGAVIIGPPSNSTTEGKVDYLVEQVLAIQSTLGALDKNLRDEQESRKMDSGRIRSEIDALNKSINAIIANHIIGDFDKNILGIIATTCGVIIQLFY